MALNIDNNRINSEFIAQVQQYSDSQSNYIGFAFNNVHVLNFNNKFVNLWQDQKGQVSYSFNLQEQEYFTTSATKLGNALSSHFQHEIEVVNNTKEYFKKVRSTATELNKAVTNSQMHAYSQQFQSQDNVIDTIEMNDYQNGYNNGQAQLPVVQQVYQQQPTINQELLHQDIIQLSLYVHEANQLTRYLYINQLPVVHKEEFRPDIKEIFFYNEKNLLCKNSYIASSYMLNYLAQPDVNGSFILSFILFMTNNRVNNAMQILAWLSNAFHSLQKSPFVLLLHSQEDIYMKLFYEEIIEPLFNRDYCVKIDNDSFNEKSLQNQLDKKVMYNFHNITTPSILGSPSKELTSRLVHKNDWKFGKKVVSTMANIMITSTTKYIPLASQDVPIIAVNVDSSIEKFCEYMSISTDYYAIAKMIENDLYNFTNVLKHMNTIQYKYHDTYIKSDDILDGDCELIEVFNTSIKNKELAFFEVLKSKSPKLYGILIDDFNKNRVNRKNLIEYFEILFGTGIYKNKNGLLNELKLLSSEKEPFDNMTTFNNNGQVYYRL